MKSKKFSLLSTNNVEPPLYRAKRVWSLWELWCLNAFTMQDMHHQKYYREVKDPLKNIQRVDKSRNFSKHPFSVTFPKAKQKMLSSHRNCIRSNVHITVIKRDHGFYLILQYKNEVKICWICQFWMKCLWSVDKAFTLSFKPVGPMQIKWSNDK